MASESAASSIDKERGGAFTVRYEGGAGTHQVVLDCFLGITSDRYEPFFVSFAEESNIAGQDNLVAVFVCEGSLEVYVVNIGVEHFAHACAGGVEEFEYGSVA